MKLKEIVENKKIKVTHHLKTKMNLLPDGVDAIFVIPDMHLHKKGSSDFFKHNESKFLDLLEIFENLKQDNPGKIKFIQLGDMFELWVQPVTLKKIYKKYKTVIEKMNHLGFKFIHGNHDYILSKLHKRKKHKYKKRRFCRIYGKSYFEHGYTPDLIETPKVWYFTRTILTGIRLMQRLYCRVVNLFLPRSKKIHPTEEVEIFGTLAYMFNHIRRNKYYKIYEKNYEKRIKFYLNYITQLGQKDLRLVVTAHTHKTHLYKSENDFYYMDCGSWTEGNRDFGIILKSELAVCKFG